MNTSLREGLVKKSEISHLGGGLDKIEGTSLPESQIFFDILGKNLDIKSKEIFVARNGIRLNHIGYDCIVK